MRKNKCWQGNRRNRESIIWLCVIVWWIFIKSPFRKLWSRLKNITYEFLSDIDCSGTRWTRCTAWAEIDASHAERDVNIKGQVRPKMNIINIIYSTSHAEGSHLQYRSPQTFLELQGKRHHSILLKNWTTQGLQMDPYSLTSVIQVSWNLQDHKFIQKDVIYMAELGHHLQTGCVLLARKLKQRFRLRKRALKVSEPLDM